MACGLALKRPLELEALHSPEGVVKRARLSPFRMSPNAASSAPSSSTTSTTTTNTSVFGPSVPRSRLSQEQLESYLKAEIKVLRRRKVLPRPTLKRKAGETTEEFRSTGNPCSSSDSEGETAVPEEPTGNRSDRSRQPTFTFSQVQQICERLLREQEERLRAQYDALLYQRLSEQYETFVKFTQDQIQRNAVAETPSYLS